MKIAGFLKKHLIGEDAAEPAKSIAIAAAKMRRFAGRAVAASLFVRNACWKIFGECRATG